MNKPLALAAILIASPGMAQEPVVTVDCEVKVELPVSEDVTLELSSACHEPGKVYSLTRTETIVTGGSLGGGRNIEFVAHHIHLDASQMAVLVRSYIALGERFDKERAKYQPDGSYDLLGEVEVLD